MAHRCEPVRQFNSLILHPGGRRCDIAVMAMEPALFTLTATLSADGAGHCFVAACIWPPPGRPRREDLEASAYLQGVVASFFDMIAAGASAGGAQSVAVEGFYSDGLGFSRGLSELFAAFASKGLDAAWYSAR